MDCDNFEIESYNEVHEVVTLNNRTNITVDLGIYSSKEKAFKVLDEIQEAIEDSRFKTINNVSLGDYVLHDSVQFYQMPLDVDVRV